MTIPTQPLTGQALIDQVQELAHLPRRQTAIHCGYVIYSETGKTQANLTDFYDALLEAKGILLKPGPRSIEGLTGA